MRASTTALCAVPLVLLAGSPAAGSSTADRCHAELSRAVIPAWARAGFSGPAPRIPHVLGESGQILAIVFGYPLRSPPAPGRNNKILWVARTRATSPSTLSIRAQRMDGDRSVGAAVRRVVSGGPGPSIVDLPQPGCWRLTLRWSSHVDRVDLAYEGRN